MRNFFESFVKSISNIQWLRAARYMPNRAWTYFFVLSFFASAIMLVPVAAKLPEMATILKNAVKQQAPDFSVQVQDGKMSIKNLKQPFILRTKDNVLLVVDTVTTTQPLLSQFLGPRDLAGFLVSNNQLEVYQVGRAQNQVTSFADMPNFTVDKAGFVAWFDRYFSTGVLILIGWFGVVVWYFVFTITVLFRIAIISAILRLLCYITKKPYRFTELFTMGLFAMTLPVLIMTVAFLTGFAVPYMFTMALFAFMAAVVFTREKSTPETVVKN